MCEMKFQYPPDPHQQTDLNQNSVQRQHEE